jgi:serine/threonine-protein kinase HipA
MSEPVHDELHLWWLADPHAPAWVGTLRWVPRNARQAAGVSLAYAPPWLATGAPLSEDLPLQAGTFLPTEPNSAAGAVDDARPDRWGERVIRLLDHPPRSSSCTSPATTASARWACPHRPRCMRRGATARSPTLTR